MRGTIFLILLALQFGLQPVFTKENVSPDADKVALVFLCEILKTIVAFLALFGEGDIRSVLSTWSLKDAITGGAVPAGVYAVQNVFIQIGYQHSSGLMFNLLNQTKINHKRINNLMLMIHFQIKTLRFTLRTRFNNSNRNYLE